jgi:ATP-binding cassette, subfamily B, multidrug efflux pump
VRPGIELFGTTQERAHRRGETARRLAAALSPHRAALVQALGFILISATAQATAPWLISRAIDVHVARGDRVGLARTMALLLATYLCGTIGTRAQIKRVGATGQKLIASFRRQLFEHFQRLPLGYFDRSPVGDLISRVINDVDTLNQLFSQGLTQLAGALFSLFGIVIAMLFLNWRLASASFTVVPVMLLTTSYLAGHARRAFRETRKTTGNVTAELQERITGIREAQAFNRTEENIARFRRQNEANRNANVQATGVTSAFAPTVDVLSTIAMAIVIGYGGYLFFQGRVSVGLLAAFLIYVQQFFRPIQLISVVGAQFQSALAGAERIFGVLDQAPEPPDSAAAADVTRVAGRIEFDHVTFGYTAERPVLHDIDFVVEPGKMVALVGKTGAGKTTIAGLIPRFYDVRSGAVRIDGRDVRSITRNSLRSQIATVLQDPFLFSGTVAENLAYGQLGATREQVVEAARNVGADDFIRSLPDGYDTRLGETGSMLSQGQRQLLSIARAVLAGPRILILDEATSRIDTRTEALIQQALSNLMAGRTSLVIAHRLSTIRHADTILVIEDGRIVERGAHADLLSRGGIYSDLYHRRFRGTE